MSETMVKIGDGRLSGIITLLSFAALTFFLNNGALADRVSPLQNIWVKRDQLATSLSVNDSLMIVTPIMIVVVAVAVFMLRRIGIGQPSIFKQKLPMLVAAFFIGIIAGLAFLFHSLSGSFGGFAITGPIFSWTSRIIGGDVPISWGMLFVIGITLGSLLSAILSKEFRLREYHLKDLFTALLAGILMAIGANLAKGCLISNGLVFTAMLSVQGWLSLLFIIIGNWTAALIMRSFNQR